MIYFPGIGTLVNMLLIVTGSFIGMFLGKRFPEKIRAIVVDAAGLVVLFIGISGIISAALTVNENGRTLDTNFTMVIVLCMILGAIIGQLLHIEEGLDAAGNWLQKKLSGGSGKSRLAEGFCSCTILFCTGAMAIVGTLNDALLADPSVLYAKGLIDGMVSIVFAATMGVGVLLSALGVGVYQGILTALATLLQPILTDTVVAEMSIIGSLIILGIGLNLLKIKKLPIGNLLPAIFLPLIWYGLSRLWS